MKKIFSIILALSLILTLMASVVTVEAAEAELSCSWTVRPSSVFVGYPLAQAFDNNINSIWHTDYSVNADNSITKVAGPHAINIEFSKKQNVTGMIYTPRQESGTLTGMFRKVYFFVSQDGINYQHIYTYDFTSGYGSGYSNRAAQKVSWGDLGFDIKAIQIETASGDAGTIFESASAAEIDLLTGGTGTPLSTGEVQPQVKFKFTGAELEEVEYSSEWQVTASSTKASTTSFGTTKNYDATNIFDNDKSTIWQSESTTLPQHIIVEFPSAINVAGLIYTPRTDTSFLSTPQGIVTQYTAYTSTDGASWTPLHSETFYYPSSYSKDADGTRGEKMSYWGNVSTKYIKLEFTASSGSGASMAELDFLHTPVDPNVYVSTSGWNISCVAAKEVVYEGVGSYYPGTLSWILDNDPSTYWHCDMIDNGGQVSLDQGPFTITIILPEAQNISGFAYTPRQNSSHSRLTNYVLKFAETDESEYKTVYSGEESVTSSAKRSFEFGFGVPVKKIEIYFEGRLGSAAIAGFDFIECDENTEMIDYSEIDGKLYENLARPMDSSDFMVRTNATTYGVYRLFNIIDNAYDSIWMANDPETDVTVEFDLGKLQAINKIEIILKESTTYDGYWDKFDVLSSKNGVDYDTLYKNFSFARKNYDTKVLSFETPLETRYIKFVIKEFTGTRISCGEVEFLQTDALRDIYNKETERYALTIGSKTINATQNDVQSQVTMDATPYLTYTGTTMIPLRGLIEKMGGTVNWDDSERTITIVKDWLTITMKPYDQLVYIDNPLHKAIIRYTLPTVPVISEGRTYIPLRFVSEHLSYDVAWNGSTKTITITK